MNQSVNPFIKLIKHPVRSRLFLLMKLPSAYFAGVRLREINEKCCEVMIPYKWFSRNPFRSTYFACLSMAAEMSTGALAMSFLYGRKPSVSMLVVKVESEYFKRATQNTYFTCEDGQLILQTIENSINTGEAKIIRLRSVGKNEVGEVIAEFHITWSFKART